MPQILEMAFRNVARTSPTLPPSAISTSAMSGRLPLADQHHADILEDRSNRRMWLVHGDLDRVDTCKRREYRVGHGAGGALQQLVIGVLERRRRGRHHAGIGYGVGQVIGARGLRQISGKFEVDDKALPDFGLVLHHAVAGVDDDAGDEDRIAHSRSLIAAVTRSACTVSATSCARMICAPFWAASRCAAIEPPRR